MAESVPYSDQLVTLFKTREGYANTNSAYEVEQETLVSRPTMLSDRIFLNNVPDNAPTDLVEDLAWGVVGQSSAQRWPSVARPWLVNYRAVLLTSFAGNPDETFYFAGTRTGGAVLPNLLTNMLLPLMTSTSAPAYTVAVDASSAPIPASNYMLDRQAGIITIYPGNGVSATQPPTLSFWRYEGTTLRDAAMSTDLCGNVTLAGTLSVTGGVTVGGTLTTTNFSTSTFTTTGLYTATGGISVTGGNLAVTNGSTSTLGLTASGLVTAQQGLTVPAGNFSVANAAAVGSLSTTGDISGNTASIAGLLKTGSLSTTGSIGVGSGLSVTGGSLTVTNKTTTGSLLVLNDTSMNGVTTGTLTAIGPINATAGLTVQGGISLPGASLTLNDLCANAVDVSGTLRVGTGTVGNSLVVSTTDASTSYIRQTDVSNGKIIFGSSAITHGAATLTVQDDGLNGSVLIKGRGTTLGGGLFIAGGDGDVSGGAVTGIITMSTNNGNEKFYLGANGNAPVWKSLELSSTTVTANLPLIAPNIGTALGTTTVAGTLVAPAIGIPGGTTTVAGTIVGDPQISLKAPLNSNTVFFNGAALGPVGTVDLGATGYIWNNVYTNNITPGAGGITRVNGTLVAPTIGNGNADDINVNSKLYANKGITIPSGYSVKYVAFLENFLISREQPTRLPGTLADTETAYLPFPPATAAGIYAVIVYSVDAGFENRYMSTILWWDGSTYRGGYMLAIGTFVVNVQIRNNLFVNYSGTITGMLARVTQLTGF
jgi:hypothetical protein